MIEINNSPRSAYLHIPFCHRRCFYCDFVIEPIGDSAHSKNEFVSRIINSYVDVLCREIKTSPKGPPLSTIYFGGGTPSLLSPFQVKKILDHLKEHFGFQDGLELTLEIDPGSFDEKSLNGYLESGFNRMSLGGQSFDNVVLKKLGRRHNPEDFKQACSLLNTAYKRGELLTWSLDLIQNLPDQKVITWRDQLKQAIETHAPHLSIYDLSVEPGTVFAEKHKKGHLNLPKEDLAIEISALTSATLKKEGFARYEISNYALPGHASRHNRVYWSGANWWAFGQGATSSAWGRRFSRPKNQMDYYKWVSDQESGLIESSLQKVNVEKLNIDDLIFVGLRRREGVDLEELAIEWGWDIEDRTKYLTSLMNYWEDFIKNGTLKNCGMRFYLTDPQGMEISNSVLVAMLRWWDSLPSNAVLPTIV